MRKRKQHNIMDSEKSSITYKSESENNSENNSEKNSSETHNGETNRENTQKGVNEYQITVSGPQNFIHWIQNHEDKIVEYLNGLYQHFIRPNGENEIENETEKIQLDVYAQMESVVRSTLNNHTIQQLQAQAQEQADLNEKKAILDLHLYYKSDMERLSNDIHSIKEQSHNDIQQLQLQFQNEKRALEEENHSKELLIENLRAENEIQLSQEKLRNLQITTEETNKIAAQYQAQIGAYLDRYQTSQPAVKGNEAENNYENTLNVLFPTCEVRRVSSEAHACDIEMFLDNQKSTENNTLNENNNSINTANNNNVAASNAASSADSILFEIKNYKNNVPKHQVDKFHNDLLRKQKHGIMISVESGIASKKSFQFDFLSASAAIAAGGNGANRSNEKVTVNGVTEGGNEVNKVKVNRQFIALYLPKHQHNQDSLVIAVNLITFLSEWIACNEKLETERMQKEAKEKMLLEGDNDEENGENAEKETLTKFNSTEMDAIKKQVEAITKSYQCAREALENAKKILDEQQLGLLKTLLGFPDNQNSNPEILPTVRTNAQHITQPINQLIANTELTPAQKQILNIMAKDYPKPVKNWSTVGRELLSSERQTLWGVVKNVMAEIGGPNLSTESRIKLIQGKAMRLRAWQNVK